MHVLQIFLLLVFSGVPMSADGEPAREARTSHGTFTGEVKPVIYVADVEKSMPFYRDALGFSFEGFADVDGGPYYAEMLAGTLKFGLHEPMNAAQEPRVGRIRIYFRVLDLGQHFERVAAWGAEPGEIVERSWMDMFSVRDPDGNVITFAYSDSQKHTSDPWKSQ